MPELEQSGGLSPEDNKHALNFNHKEFFSAKQVERLTGDADTAEVKYQNAMELEGKIAQRTGERAPVELSREVGKLAYATEKTEDKLKLSQDTRDANLWRAEQHKNELLPEYKAQAASEAADKGIDVTYDSGSPESDSK